MTQWKTTLTLFVLIAIAVLCYPHASSGIAPSGAPKIRLTLWAGMGVSDATRTTLDSFEKQNPQYHVEVGANIVRNMTADPTRFLLSVAGGDPPDVILFDRFAVDQWAVRGAFKNLDAYLAKDASRSDGVHAGDFYKPLWAESLYKGHQYGIPRSVDIRALFINDDLFIRAGLKKPASEGGGITPPKSWEDICRKKFHGTGTVTLGGLVHLGAPSMLPGTNAPYPVSPGPPKPGDVVTLRSGSDLFRARIKDVTGPNSFSIDFSRELPPGTNSVPSSLLSAPNLEIKLFDANSFTIKTSHFDAKGNLEIAGFAPLNGNSWLFFYAAQEGASFVSPDGKTILLDEPQVEVALQFMTDCYDAIGGYKVVEAFNDSQSNAVHDPFFSGKVAMTITGNWFLSSIAQYSPNLRFTLVPVPLPQARIDRGEKPFTWAGGWTWCIPSTAHHPDAAWALIRYLSSESALKLNYEYSVDVTHAAGQSYIPDLPIRTNLIPFIRQNYLTPNSGLDERLINAYSVFTTLLPDARFRPHSPVGQRLWEAHINAQNACIEHTEEIHPALATANREVQQDLDHFLHPPTGPVVNWYLLIGIYIFLLAVGAGFLALHEVRRRKKGFPRRDWKAGFICVSPWLLGFIIFGAGPILFSLIISFCRYDVLHPAQFVGLQNYIQLLGFHTDHVIHKTVANDPYLWKSLANTAYMLLGLPIGITAGLLLAMLLSHEIRGMAIFRTLYYLPSIIPAVASFVLWMWIFDPTRGLLNTSLMALGVEHPPNWLAEVAWSKPAIIIMGLWGVGGGMLIWLAGIKAIPLQLYEAAEIDGASSLRQFLHVTLPMLSPYIFFNTVMGIIGTLQVFEAAYIMTDGGPSNSTLFYCYYLFNQAFRYLDMGAASAMAWILFTLVLALTLFQLYLGKKWVHYD